MDLTPILRDIAANTNPSWDHHVYDIRSHEQATIDDAVAVFESILEPLKDLESDEEETVEFGPTVAEGDVRNQLTLISSERNNNKEILLTVETFIWVPQMPEYPITSETGVCYVISVRGKTKEQARSYINEIQFCHSHKISWRQTTCAFLDNTLCNRVTYKCRSKACEYLSSDLRNRSYTEVSEDEWDLVAKAKQEAERAIDDQVHYKTLCFLYAKVKLFEDGKLCNPYAKTCKLEIVQDGDATGVPRHIFRCIHSHPHSQTPSDVRHHWRPIPQEHNPAIKLFQAFLNKTLGEEIQPGSCYYVAQNKKLAKLCPVVHPQGKGNIIELTCQCEYDFYIPLHLDLYPYMLCVC
ncbi:uncharacterized protein BCR38DRAFT_478103, partial [Pseudomassariella vexata]